MQLTDLISIEYKERGRNKANFVIHNDINMLWVFLASFSRNMDASRLCAPFPIRRVVRRQPSQNKAKWIKTFIIRKMERIWKKQIQVTYRA
jgi:hypothetical protein